VAVLEVVALPEAAVVGAAALAVVFREVAEE
jgi:hypothetical protein